MDVNTYNTLINCPDIGFDHVLVFKTSAATINEEGECIKNSIKRRVQIIHTGKKGTLHKYQVFLVETECIFHYTLEPYTVLLRRLTYVFDECFIGVTENGSIAALFNAAFIQYRWKQIRSKLMQEHEGEVFEQYIKEMDMHTKDHGSMLNYLQQHSVYGLYFNGYWNSDMKSTNILKKSTSIDGENYEMQEVINLSAIPSELADACMVEARAVLEDDARQMHMHGKYIYIDGILSDAEHSLKTNSTEITHYATWAGLRKRL